MDRLLHDTLGPEGAAALAAAVAATPALDAVVRPRAALAWAQLAVQHGFEGAVPGTDAPLLVKGEAWTATVDGAPHSGTGTAGLAAVIIALNGGVTVAMPHLRSMTRLAKNLDQLASAAWRGPVAALRARARGLGLAKAAPPSKDGPGHPHAAQEPLAPQVADAPTAPRRGRIPVAAEPPAPAVAPQARPGAEPKRPEAKVPMPKVRAAPLRMSELARPCSVCGRAQLTGTQLTGCGCWAEALTKGEAILLPTGLVLVRLEDQETTALYVKAVKYGE